MRNGWAKGWEKRNSAVIWTKCRAKWKFLRWVAPSGFAVGVEETFAGFMERLNSGG
jgi:hypothetical protein